MVSDVVIVCVVVEVIEPCVKLGTTGTAYTGAATATPIAYTIYVPLLNIIIAINYWIVNSVTNCAVAEVPLPPPTAVTVCADVTVPVPVPLPTPVDT